MNERNTRRQPRSEAVKTNNEQTTYPKWAKATAAGALAVGAVFGVHELTGATSEQSKPQDSYSVEGSVPIVVQEGESVIDATYRVFDKTSPSDSQNLSPKPADILKTPLTDTQKSEIVVSAKHATDQHGANGARLQVQPGDVYIADVGEFDGDDEIDVRVRPMSRYDSINEGSYNNVNVANGEEVENNFTHTSLAETLPDYYQDK